MSTAALRRPELARGEVLPTLDDEDDLRARLVSSMRLDGQSLDVRVGSAIGDVTEEATIEGASTLTISLVDEGHELLASTIFNRAVDVEVGVGDEVLAYRLVKISAPDNRLVLTLEDRDVAYMRQHKRPRKASRAHVTMAEFVLMLVREVKATRIRLWCPELHVKQPITRRRQLDSRAVKDREHGRGLGAGEGITVKRHRADRAQLRVLEAVLDVGDSMAASRRVLIGGVMCVTQESEARNLRGGDRNSVGAFQQRPGFGWPASRDVARDARGFYRVALPVFTAHPEKSIGWCVDQVQRSGTFGTSRQGRDYDQWRSEAEETVDAYLGNAPARGGGRPSSVYVKRFWFRRGEPGGKREDTWTCAKRLAEERHWRCFMDRGLMHLASDDQLMRARVRLTIKRGALPPGVAKVRISDFDAGKRAAEVELTVFTDSWRTPIGAVVELVGYGEHVSGNYLVATRRGSLLRQTRTVTIVRRRPKLAEPASELVTRSGGDVSVNLRDSLEGSKVGAAYARAKSIEAKRYPYVWGGGHASAGRPSGGGFDCSGGVVAVLAAGGFGFREGGPTATSGTLMSWGAAGKGQHLTVYANSEHTFIVFHDVGSGKGDEHWGSGRWGESFGGVGFKPQMHPTSGFVARHWPGT